MNNNPSFNLWTIYRNSLIILGPYFVLRYGLFILFPNKDLYGIWQGDIPQSIHQERRAMDNKVVDSDPEVVIVGNSLVPRGIDADLLAEELGLQANSVLLLSSPGGRMPTFYAIVTGRIFGNNKTPKLIIILGTPRWLLSNDTPRKANFNAHLSDPDQHLKRVIKKEDLSQNQFKQKAKNKRQDYLDYIRYLFGEKLFGIPDSEVITTLDKLFTFENRRKDEKKAHLPVVVEQNTRSKSNNSTDKFSIPEEEYQLYTHLIERIHAEGSQVVFVEAPTTNEIQNSHTLPLTVHRNLIENIQRMGGGYLSYFNWNPSEIFADDIHFNQRGQYLFTKSLATDLKRIQALSENMTPAVLPSYLKKVQLKWNQTDENQESRKSLAVNGNVELEFSDKWTNLNFKLVATIATNPPKVLLNDQPINIQSNIEQINGKGIWRGQVTLPSLSKSDRITIVNTQQSAELPIHSIQLDDVYISPAQQYLSVFNVSTISANNGTVSSQKAKINSTSNAEAQDQMRKTKGLLISDLENFTPLTLKKIVQKGPKQFEETYLIECLPFNLEYQNKQLEPMSCDTFNLQKKANSHCYSDGKLYLFPENINDISQYSLQLKQQRECRGAFWFFPNDQLTINTKVNSPTFGLTSITLFGHQFDKGEWTIEVMSKDRTLFTTTFHEIDHKIDFPLNLPLYNSNEIEIRLTGSSFLYLSDILLHN
jgi:hypothetical protein